MIQIDALNDLDLSEEPFAPDWEGSLSHIGPVEAATPLVGLVAGKTTMGTLTLMAGVLLWAAKRIHPFYDATHCVEMAEASFAWHWDWRYFEPTAKPFYVPPEQPAAPSALFVTERFLRLNIDEEDQWYSFFQPVMPLSHMINVTRFILPKHALPAFEEWLVATSQLLDRVARAPDIEQRSFYEFENREAYQTYCAPRRGTPLPPDVLNPGTAPTDGDVLLSSAAAHVNSLNPDANRFLRSVDEMREMGYDGQPYNESA